MGKDFDLSLIITSMRRIGKHILAWRATEHLSSYTYKQGKEVVSQLDRRAEMEVRKMAKKYFHGWKIWGEELGRDPGSIRHGRWIVIDAIDGTKNYLSGNPLFASQIAFVVDNVVVAGIVNLPALGELFHAERGKGAFLNGVPIHPSTQKSLSLSLQCFGIGHDAENFLLLAQLIREDLAEPRHYGCAGVHYAFVACGRTDIYIAKEAAYYDAAAGILLCEEVGLGFSTLNGETYIPGETNLGLVIANTQLLGAYREKVAKR